MLGYRLAEKTGVDCEGERRMAREIAYTLTP